MAQATEEQAKLLEKVYKTQFHLMVQALRLYFALREKYVGGNMSSEARTKLGNSLYDYGQKTLMPMWVDLIYFTKKLRSGGIQVPLPDVKQLFVPEYFPTLEAADKYNNAEKPAQGIGFIPLLIWAVIAIVGMFTVQDIVKQVDSTVAQQEDLVVATQKLCETNGLTGEDCKSILLEQQKTVQTTDNSSSTGGFIDMIKWGLLAYLGIQVVGTFNKK